MFHRSGRAMMMMPPQLRQQQPEQCQVQSLVSSRRYHNDGRQSSYYSTTMLTTEPTTTSTAFVTYNNNTPRRILLVFTPKRYIQSEREYITIVTNTLQTIHDTIDGVLDQQSYISDYEISFAQGVLTMKFPPHGTWVLNQQTPNLQIWVRVYMYIFFTHPYVILCGVILSHLPNFSIFICIII